MRAVDRVVLHVVERDGDAQHRRQRDEVRADVPVDEGAVVRAPVGHDAVDVLESALPGQAGGEPGRRPGAVGAQVDLFVHVVGQQGGPALGELKHGAEPVDEVEAHEGDGHLRVGLKVGGEPAAAEVLIVGAAPVGRTEHRFDIGIGDVEPLLHAAVSALVLRDAGGVERRRTRVDEVQEAVGGDALRAASAHPLDRLGAPVGAHVGEDGGAVGQQRLKEHGDAVAGVVLGGEHGRALFAVPVEGAVVDRLHEVAVREPVGPLALPLEAARDRVAAERLLVPAHLGELGIAVQDVVADERLLDDELPVLVGRDDLGFRDDLRQVLAGVAVEALLTIGLDPFERLLILVMVVDLQRDAADDLGHVDPLGADAQIFLEKVGVAVGAGDAHRDAAEVDVRLVPHEPHRDGAAREPQQLLRHVRRDRGVVGVLHVVAVDRKDGQIPLRVGGHGRREVDRAGALGAVEAPDRLDGQRVEVHRLAAVAPAGGYRQGRHDVFGGELLGHLGRLRAAADRRAADDALDRGAVGICKVLRDQLRRRVSHAHRLVFEALADAAPPAVDDRPDANFRITHEMTSFSLTVEQNPDAPSGYFYCLCPILHNRPAKVNSLFSGNWS